MSGIETLNSISALVLNSTGGEFDIVSWDPRGVGSLTVYVYHFCCALFDWLLTCHNPARVMSSASTASMTTTRSGTGRLSSTASR